MRTCLSVFRVHDLGVRVLGSTAWGLKDWSGVWDVLGFLHIERLHRPL